MKKVFKYLIWGIVLFLVGFCIYMECKNPTVRMEKSKMTQEKILKECPEIAISEEDLALEKLILDLPEVKNMIEQSSVDKKLIWVSNAEVVPLLSGWIEDGWSHLELACEQDVVYLLWIKDGEKMLSYDFTVDSSYPMQKRIGTYEKHFNGTTSVDVIYENVDGVIVKNVCKRQWFYWVNELLINGFNGNMFF